MKNHQNSCTTNRSRLSTVLANAKELFAVRKAKRLQAIAMTRRRQLGGRDERSPNDLSQRQDTSPPFDSEVVSPAQALDYYLIRSKDDRQAANDPSDALVRHYSINLHHSVADDSQVDTERRPSKRRRIAPNRYPGLVMYDKRLRDILPQAPAALIPNPTLPSPLPSGSPAPPSSYPPPHIPSALDVLPVQPSCQVNIRVFIDSAHNVFGIFRRYHGPEFPRHDPEREINLSILSNIPAPPKETLATSVSSAFHPYPNENSFLLGDWYWNHGSQKSQEDFKKLLDIVGSAKFSPRDVRGTSWNRINQAMGVNDWDEGEWVDEDAGWQKSDISIRVPFHRFLDNPGVRVYTVKNFYHRSLTSIIQERLKNDAENNCHFHFEPFELLWKPDLSSLANNPDDAAIRLYGELYTSPAFINAHWELQDITGEPNCDLPRVVVGLMFWSDATLLATYGHAKLWPLYMAFANDSKYQRCKPTSNLYEHVAYFEQVKRAECYLLPRPIPADTYCDSSQTSSRILQESL
jgi:hypothetical protein